MTAKGLKDLKDKLHALLQQRHAVVEDIARAREFGDLSENAEYHAAKENQRRIESSIAALNEKISGAEVIDPSNIQDTHIVFGAWVTLYDEDRQKRFTYQIVGTDEADLTQNTIAINSTLARELIGKEAGMSIELSTPGGERHYIIENVSYVDPHDTM